jgi:hypothetical protein
MDPKVNEVWITGSGRLCLIVAQPESYDDKIAMLWFDEISKEFTVSPIYARLATKTTLTPGEFFSSIGNT